MTDTWRGRPSSAMIGIDAVQIRHPDRREHDHMLFSDFIDLMMRSNICLSARVSSAVNRQVE